MILRVFVYLTFLLFTMGQLGRVSLLNQEVNFYIYEVSLLVTFVILLYQYRLKPLTSSVKKFKILSVFFIFLLFSFCFNTNVYTPLQNLVAFSYYLRLLFYFVFFLYLYYVCKKDKKLLRDLGYGILASSFGMVVLGILQYFFYGDLRNLLYLGWDPHLFRIFGTFLEPVIFGSIVGLILLFILTKQVFSRRKYLRIFISCILLVLIFLTFSRDVYIAILTSISVYYAREKLHYVVGLFIISGLILVLLPKPFGEGVNLLRTSTISSRLIDYQEGVELFKKSPLYGTGYNHIRYEKKSINAPGITSANHAGSAFHSSFLTILATSGIIGLGLYIFVLWRMGSISVYSGSAVFFLTIVSLFDNVLLHPFILFFLFTSICVSVSHLSGRLR